MLASVSIGDAFDVLVIVLLWRRDGQSGMSGLPKLGLVSRNRRKKMNLRT